MVVPFDHANIPRPRSPGLTPAEAFKKDLLLQVTHEWRSSEALAQTRNELVAGRLEAQRRRLEDRRRKLAERMAQDARRFRKMARRRRKQHSVLREQSRKRALMAEESRRMARPAQGVILRSMMVAARAYKVPAMEMFGPTREHHIAEARFAAWHRAYIKMLNPRLTTIARFVGRDHTTILHGIRRHCERQGLPCPPGLSEWRNMEEPAE